MCKGKRGRGAASKVAVFGILKRGGKIYTKVVHDTKTEILMPLIARKIMPDSVVYTYCYRSYNALDVSDFYHERINHSASFAKGKITLMTLRASGIKPSVCCENIMEFQKNRFRYSSGNANSDSFMEPRNNN